MALPHREAGTRTPRDAMMKATKGTITCRRRCPAARRGSRQEGTEGENSEQRGEGRGSGNGGAFWEDHGLCRLASTL